MRKRVKVHITLAGAAALALCCCDPAPVASRGAGSGAAAKKAKAGAKPAISCAAPIYEFGKISQGKSVEHAFTIKNVGGAMLKITGARGG